MRWRAHSGRKPASLAGRCLVVVLSAATLVAQLSALVHLGLVRHVICAEHGELIHADDVDHSPATPAQAVSPATTARTTSASGRHEGSAYHGHEHCLMAAHRRERAVPSNNGWFSFVSEPPPSDTTESSAVPRPAPVAIYRLAPKSSPPA